jgi:hypothetical protein
MRLLLDFLCRFGWGLAAGLVLTAPRVVPAGFFRVNLLVVMGVATLAALVAGGTAGVRTLAAVAAVSGWLGSVAWLGEKRRAGVVFCVVAALVLAAGTVQVAMSHHGAGPIPGATPFPGVTSRFVPPLAALLSGLVTGLTVHAMLLGHWYLNAPGMRVDALRRAIDLAAAAWALQVLATLAAGGTWDGLRAGGTTAALVAMRWLAGLVGLPVLLMLARRTLEIPNTQSATGILYVACLAAILGELTGQLLMAGG